MVTGGFFKRTSAASNTWSYGLNVGIVSHLCYSVGSSLNNPSAVITGMQDPTVPPGDWHDMGPTTTADADLYHYTGASAITGVWAKAQACEGEPVKVDLGADGIECRSSCDADASGLPPVLDCRAQMAHDYDFAKTWPMILEFFARQPQR